MIPLGCPARTARCLLLAAGTLGGAITALPAQQRARVDPAALQQVLQAEDARGTGSAGLAPLLQALGSRDTLLRRVAVRGIGRLQRADLGRRLLPALTDPTPAIRAEAANAIAQSLSRSRRGAAGDSSQLTVGEAQEAILAAMGAEKAPGVAGAMAEAVGRLPLADSAAARRVERGIVARSGGRPDVAMVHGLYTLAKARRLTGALSGEAVRLLREVAVTAPSAESRRLALLTLTTTLALDSSTTLQASRDPDPQVRRLALAGAPRLSPAGSATLFQRALTDTSAVVRVAVMPAIRAQRPRPDCTLILRAVADRDPYVALTAIDALGSPCDDPSASIRALSQVLDGSLGVMPAAVDHRWQAGAHALRALARLDSSAAASWLPRFAASPRWGERLAAAEAAANAKDRVMLFALSRDADHNVREAALAGLSKVAGHAADSTYIDALASSGYQVVLAAATALSGSADAGALPAMLTSFDRLSAERRENARDPRVALLQRISELGGPATIGRLTPYLADFDTLIATTVAATLGRWSGTAVRAHPAPLPLRAEPLAATFLQPRPRLRVTMAPGSGGGSFVVELFGDEAPATVARIIRLVRAHYYDGHVFQRVEPNFVVQGSGPDASEYVGDSTFMRDELTSRSHDIGTLGISSRGRDTGDAQWFINVVDNPLLDHEYTVFGRIVTGLGVARQILEGDRIATVAIVPVVVEH